jgi:hypothetical protein
MALQVQLTGKFGLSVQILYKPVGVGSQNGTVSVNGLLIVVQLIYRQPAALPGNKQSIRARGKSTQFMNSWSTFGFSSRMSCCFTHSLPYYSRYHFVAWHGHVCYFAIKRLVTTASYVVTELVRRCLLYLL